MLLAACAAPRDGSEDSWSRRASDFLDPIVPDSVTLGPREPALKATVKLDPAEVVLAERREVRVIFTVQNTTRRIQRLDFPTAQRIELALLAPDGKRIFLMATLHHHFQKKNWPETRVVVRFWILSVLFALAGLATLKLR
jgi:hypothetical protein